MKRTTQLVNIHRDLRKFDFFSVSQHMQAVKPDQGIGNSDDFMLSKVVPQKKTKKTEDQWSYKRSPKIWDM